MVGNRSRRDPSARRPRHGEAGRGRAGRRRAALRAPVRRPRHDRRASAADPTAPAGRPASAPPRKAARQEALSRESADERNPAELHAEIHHRRGAAAIPTSTPKDASTLILLDRSGPEPKVLMGKRHHGHMFMPGKFVFPGGRVEPVDRLHAGRARRSIRAPRRN